MRNCRSTALAIEHIRREALFQRWKAWTTGQTDDISLKTLLLFACGLGLWVVYGVLQKDIIIILANGVSLALLAGLLYLKLVQTPS